MCCVSGEPEQECGEGDYVEAYREATVSLQNSVQLDLHPVILRRLINVFTSWGSEEIAERAFDVGIHEAFFTKIDFVLITLAGFMSVITGLGII